MVNSLNLIDKTKMSIIVQPYHYEVKETKEDLAFDEIRVYATDRESKRHIIHIRDFGNTVYLQLPPKDENGDEFKWGFRAAQSVTDYILFCLKPDDRSANPQDHQPISTEPVMRRTLYYYQKNQSPFIRMVFKSKMALKHAVSLLRTPRKISKLNKTFKFTILEDDIVLHRKFCTEKNMRYTDWISCSVVNSDARRICRYINACEWDVAHSTVVKLTDPIYKSISVNMTIFTFDIEVYSDGGFPNAFHPKHEVFMISITVHRFMDLSNVKKYCYHTVDVCDRDDDVKRVKFESEKSLLQAYSDLIIESDPTIITGYNILGFDLPYMHNRLARLGNTFPVNGVTIEDKGLLKNTYNTFYGSADYIESSGRITIDVMHQVITDSPKMRTYKLAAVSQLFLGETKHDVTPEFMFKAFEKCKRGDSDALADMTQVAYYCDQDAFLTARLFEKLSFQAVVIGRAGILGINPMSVPCGSSEQRSESLLYNKAHEKGCEVVLNKRKQDYMYLEGGFVSVPVKGTHKDVPCTDFNSLYPSIMMSENICFTTLENPDEPISETDVNVLKYTQHEPLSFHVDDEEDDTSEEKKKVDYVRRWVKDTVREGIIPALCRELVGERKEAKKLIKVAKSPIERMMADQRQQGLKIAANALYGFLGMQRHGKYPLAEAAQTICGVGRNSIIRCADYMKEKYQCELIYGDTDSIMFKYPGNHTTKEIIEMATKHAAELSTLFKKPMNMELEKVMFMISRMKKNYAYLIADDNGVYNTTDPGNDLVIKGMVPTRRDNCNMLSTLFVDCLMSRFNQDTDQARTIFDTFELMFNVARDLVAGKISNDKLTISGSVNENYTSSTAMMAVFAEECQMRGQPIQPGRVEYIVVKPSEKGEVIGKRMRIADPESKDKCDPDYYLMNMFYKPLDDLFQVLYPSLPNKQLTVGKKKVCLSEPAKAIAIAFTENENTTAVRDWYRKEYAKIDHRIKPKENDFFKPRGKRT